MEPKEEEMRTDIATEEPVAFAKGKKPLWWFMVLGAVLLLVATWAGFRAFRRSEIPANEPTAEESQQLKYDSEQKEREEQKASQLRDQPFLVRKEDDSQAQVGNLLKDLNIKRDSGDLLKPMEASQAKSEEEAIAHVLKNPTPVRTPSVSATTEMPRRTVPQPQASAPPDAGSSGPMFVYSRVFGGAKYVDVSPKPAIQSNSSSTNSAPNNATKASSENVQKADDPSEEKTELIYTDCPPVTLYEGEILDAVLVNRLIADTEPSPVICHLSRDLFDQSAQYVVLPANSRIIGSSQVVNYKGAHRLFVNFSRIILPNGPSIELPSSRKALKALDETGALGVVSKVERHWFLQFGTAIFFGVLDGLAAAAQRNQDALSTGAMVLGRSSENFGRILENIMSQYSTIVPTIRIDQGKTMRIYLSDDIVITPYAKISDRSYYAHR